MNQSNYAARVGFFVAVGLALIALLVLNFSQGLTLFNPTYTLHLMMPSGAGLKPAADVMMAGVPVGKVVSPALNPDGRSVNITLTILQKYKIPKDATFHIDSLGFLGDQYIEVSPVPLMPGATNSETGYLHNGETVQGEASFNLLAAERSTADLLEQVRKTIKDVDQAITNVNRTVLSDQTLKEFATAISNFASVTQIAIKTVQGADDLVQTNSPAVAATVTNLEAVSEKFSLMADQVELIITTNTGSVNDAVKNLRDTTASFKQLAAGLQAGKGLAGGLLNDEEMKSEATALVSNANVVAAEFSDFGSNLNKEGIWRMLWKPKHTERSPDPVH
ncbi:MAG TPA: MlaD family protein [Candidatus Baltobacteraceae bacterium]|jgi:phospholipid/cholesterol/gamma-HCH transport system substrate-binding protein|nr:MlaD family protein [Candidatus Baltobacteraceae bacterium]